MYTPPHLLSLIEQRLNELGMTQAQLGHRAFGKADNTAIQSLKKGSSPAIDRLEAMASAIGWELYFGPPRRQAAGLSEPAREHDFALTNATRAGYSPLPWLDYGIGKGSAPVAFLDTWLESSGLIFDNLSATTPTKINIAGLEPKRTLAVIDKSAPRQGYGIWCLKEGTQTLVARTLFSNEHLVIQASTNDLSPRIVEDWRGGSIQPAGKVVWLGLLSPE